MKKTFILLTRLASEETDSRLPPGLSLEAKARAVKESVKAHCPKVSWTENYAVLGPWDYLDVFEAPDTETAMKVAALVRFHGGAQAEVWPAVPWDGYKKILHDVSEQKHGRTA